MKTGSRAGWVLSPLGAARKRLDPVQALPPAVASRLDDADLGPEEAYLVWQMSALAEGLGEADRLAFSAVVAESLIAVGQGSTRAAVTEATRALLAQIPDLVGPPGTRCPLILEGPHLYHHRHFTSEQQLATAIHTRRHTPAMFPPEAIESALNEVTSDRGPPGDLATPPSDPADVATKTAPTDPGDRSPSPRAAGRGRGEGSPTLDTTLPQPLHLTDDQRTAVRSALGRPLAVVSGPPGSGKTTLAVTLLRALVKLGVPADAIALAAPTGKAANRLQEAVAAGLAASAGTAILESLPAAATLHRLLGYSPSARAFAHRESSPLPHRVVIVDESSMVDLVLMDHLFRALKPDTSLILLGDADQLPSVEAGAVFRDLAPLGARLAHSHRLDASQPPGRRILDLAAAVRAGSHPDLLLHETAATLTFDGPQLLAASEREPLLERWFDERIAASPDLPPLRSGLLPLDESGFPPEVEARLDALHAHYQRFRLLAVTRGRPTGAAALNAWMHRRLGATSAAPIPGEPILMLRNDYDRALWNGDQGLCVRVREEGRPPRTAAAFKVRGRWTAWHLESLRDSLSLAFALTVHKSQGSEHDHVALILPDTALPLTSRELLYTAITRARRSVTICGSPGVLRAAITTPQLRSSGLPEKLGA